MPHNRMTVTHNLHGAQDEVNTMCKIFALLLGGGQVFGSHCQTGGNDSALRRALDPPDGHLNPQDCLEQPWNIENGEGPIAPEVPGMTGPVEKAWISKNGDGLACRSTRVG